MSETPAHTRVMALSAMVALCAAATIGCTENAAAPGLAAQGLPTHDASQWPPTADASVERPEPDVPPPVTPIPDAAPAPEPDAGPQPPHDAGSGTDSSSGPPGTSTFNTPCDEKPGFVSGPELCDGLDNDCDGTVDDYAACSDLDPCTLDACHSDGPDSFCVHTTLPDGYACEGNKSCIGGLCIGASTCGDGVCGPGETCESCQLDCGQCPVGGEECGNGVCVQDEWCASCPEDCGPCQNTCTQGACDDGDPCTVGDTCVDGLCQPGTYPLACGGGPCEVGACEAGVGCVYENLADGTPCASGWSCQEGSCVPTATSAGSVIITEIMSNPKAVNDGEGEWFELYNTTGIDITLNGWKVGDASGNLHTISSETDVVIPSGGYLVFTLNGTPGSNGGIAPDYCYASSAAGGPDFYLNNNTDHLSLYWLGTIIDRVHYGMGISWPLEEGQAMQLSANALDDDANDDAGFWCLSTATYGQGDKGTPGGPNAVCP